MVQKTTAPSLEIKLPGPVGGKIEKDSEPSTSSVQPAEVRAEQDVPAITTSSFSYVDSIEEDDEDEDEEDNDWDTFQSFPASTNATKTETDENVTEEHAPVQESSKLESGKEELTGSMPAQTDDNVNEGPGNPEEAGYGCVDDEETKMENVPSSESEDEISEGQLPGSADSSGQAHSSMEGENLSPDDHSGEKQSEFNIAEKVEQQNIDESDLKVEKVPSPRGEDEISEVHLSRTAEQSGQQHSSTSGGKLAPNDKSGGKQSEIGVTEKEEQEKEILSDKTSEAQITVAAERSVKEHSSSEGEKQNPDDEGEKISPEASIKDREQKKEDTGNETDVKGSGDSPLPKEISSVESQKEESRKTNEEQQEKPKEEQKNERFEQHKD